MTFIPKLRYLQSKTRIWRPLNDLSFAIVLNLFLTLLIQKDVLVYGANGDRGIIPGQGSRHITCPPASEILPCTCLVLPKGLDIVCDNADENHIQNALDRLKKRNFPIYWMKFRSCKLHKLRDYSFLSLDVNHLNIIGSNVSTIERSALSSLGGVLYDLDLSSNNINRIPTESFHPLKYLSFLNLNDNKITAIEANAFDGMVRLVRLSLYENKISRIHDNAFKGIGRTLSRLNLGKNHLSKIPTDAFHRLKNLFILELKENKINHLPEGAFVGLHQLDMLKLEHNEIDTIQDNVFSGLTKLNSLNIEGNKITNISHKAFAGLETYLGWLELGHNRLDHIPSHALRPLHNLRQLDLESNRIHDVMEDAFRGYGDTLKFLLLDKNHIEYIPPLTFIDLHSLEWLKLSHNELKTLTEDTVNPIIDTLTHIDISNNPLICNCEIYWLYQWLVDPNNSDNVEFTDDHRCMTDDRKVHTIRFLSDSHFNCKRKTKFQKVAEFPFSNDTEINDVIVQTQQHGNVSEKVNPKQHPEKNETTSSASREMTSSVITIIKLMATMLGFYF